MRRILIALALLLAGCGGSDTPEIVTDEVSYPEDLELVEPAPPTVLTTSTTVASTTTTTTIAPLVIRYTHPSTLSAALQRASKERMGRNAYATDIQIFTKSFHAMEREQQTAAYEGRTYYDLDPYSQAIAWLERNRASEIQAHDVAEQYENFRDIMGRNDRDNDNVFGTSTTTSTSTTTTTTR